MTLKVGHELIVKSGASFLEAFALIESQTKELPVGFDLRRFDSLWTSHLFARRHEIIPDEHIDAIIRLVMDVESARKAYWSNFAVFFLLAHDVTAEQIKEYAEMNGHTVVEVKDPEVDDPPIQVMTLKCKVLYDMLSGWVFITPGEMLRAAIRAGMSRDHAPGCSFGEQTGDDESVSPN